MEAVIITVGVLALFSPLVLLMFGFAARIRGR